MNPTILTTYGHYLERVGDPSAAGCLTLADAIQSQLDLAASRRTTAVESTSNMTVLEAAKVMGISVCTVYELCQTKRLPHHRVGRAIRITPADIAAFRESTQSEPLQAGRFRKLRL